MSKRRHGRVRLRPFDRRWAETVLGWISSADELFHWSARSDFPLTQASVFDEWHSDPDVAPYVLRIEQEIVAYGEIWEEETEGSAELGRLVVSPPHRRQGFGRLLIDRLASRTREAGFHEIWVRVLPTNAPALRCYESAGFLRASPEQQATFN